MNENQTINSIIDQFYAHISGTVEDERDWESFKTLFTKDARLKPIKKNSNNHEYVDINTYIENLSVFFKKQDFYEYGLDYKVLEFRDIATVSSKYIAKKRMNDNEIIKQGVNFIHLVKEENEWKISSMVWQDE